MKEIEDLHGQTKEKKILRMSKVQQKMEFASREFPRKNGGRCKKKSS